MQNSFLRLMLKSQRKNCRCLEKFFCEFWISIEKYKEVSGAAIKLLLQFCTVYLYKEYVAYLYICASRVIDFFY